MRCIWLFSSKLNCTSCGGLYQDLLPLGDFSLRAPLRHTQKRAHKLYREFVPNTVNSAWISIVAAQADHMWPASHNPRVRGGAVRSHIINRDRLGAGAGERDCEGRVGRTQGATNS